MKIDLNLWNKAILLERAYNNKHVKLTRKVIASELELSDRTACDMLFALENKNIISKQVNDIPVTIGYTLVISDIHIPFQDDYVLNLIWDYVKNFNITRLVILGDLIDFYRESIFRKDPNKKDAAFEIEQARLFLHKLRNMFPDHEIIYKQGNHEERLENLILDKVPDLYNLLKNILQEKLELEKLNIKYQVEYFKIGYLWYLHGHEKPKGAGQAEYITNVLWKYIHDNFIAGHFHREQNKIFPHISGKRFQGSVIGWLGDYRQIDYSRFALRNDNQGFALVEYDDRGRFKTYTKKIVEGEVF